MRARYLILVVALGLFGATSAGATMIGDVTLKVSNLGGTSLQPPGPLYIGQENILQIWFANDADLSAFTTGFQFESTIPYSWVANYGDKPTTSCGSFCRIVKTEPAAVGYWDVTGGVSVVVTRMPDSVLLGGDGGFANRFPQGASRLVYSMKLLIPFTPDSTSNYTFCIDNILYPPAGTWTFAEQVNTYPPTFQDNPNTSQNIPDAPNVCFEIRRFPGDANGDGIANITDVVFTLNYIFNGGSPPVPYSAGDFNCSGIVNIADIVYLIIHIFSGGPAPCPPD